MTDETAFQPVPAGQKRQIEDLWDGKVSLAVNQRFAAFKKVMEEDDAKDSDKAS